MVWYGMYEYTYEKDGVFSTLVSMESPIQRPKYSVPLQALYLARLTKWDLRRCVPPPRLLYIS